MYFVLFESASILKQTIGTLIIQKHTLSWDLKYGCLIYMAFVFFIQNGKLYMGFDSDGCLSYRFQLFSIVCIHAQYRILVYSFLCICIGSYCHIIYKAERSWLLQKCRFYYNPKRITKDGCFAFKTCIYKTKYNSTFGYI